MKKLTTIILLLASLTLSAQTVECDSIKAEICCDKGHFPDGVYATTEMPIKIRATEKMKITFNPNLKLYVCGRCKCFIEEQMQERPDTIYLNVKRM